MVNKHYQNHKERLRKKKDEKDTKILLKKRKIKGRKRLDR